MAQPSDIIDWTEAMQQCGEDEEFLRELLADLRHETETQVSSIEGIFQVMPSIVTKSKSSTYSSHIFTLF